MSALLIGALLFHNASAEMYKWTDKNGETHYTQTPPPPEAEGKDIEADISLSAGKTSINPTKPDEVTKPEEKATPDKAEDKKTDAEKAKASEQEHRDFCNSQKDALSQLKTNSLVKWRDEKGEHFLTADEKTEKMNLLNKNIETMCGAAMFSSQSGPADKSVSSDNKK